MTPADMAAQRPGYGDSAIRIEICIAVGDAAPEWYLWARSVWNPACRGFAHADPNVAPRFLERARLAERQCRYLEEQIGRLQEGKMRISRSDGARMVDCTAETIADYRAQLEALARLLATLRNMPGEE